VHAQRTDDHDTDGDLQSILGLIVREQEDGARAYHDDM
jgi:hypothetical protein